MVSPEFFEKLAIYWFLEGTGHLEKFRGHPGPKMGQKRGFSRSLGAFWAKRVLNADPLNPVWGPMCPLGPGYGRFLGGWGPFRQLGAGFVCQGPNPQKTVSAVTQRHRRVFRTFLAHWNRVCVAQLSNCDDVGWVHPSLSINSRSTGFPIGLGT